jgi:hypothetical protein
MTAADDPAYTIRQDRRTGKTAIRSARTSPALPWTNVDTGVFLQDWNVKDWDVIGGPNNFEETR